MTEVENRRRSCAIGYLLSMAGKPMSFGTVAEPQPENKRYMYEGELLPEWDTNTYPYAFMIALSNPTKHDRQMYVFVGEPTTYWVESEVLPESNGYYHGSGHENYNRFRRYRRVMETNEWVFQYEKEGACSTELDSVIWANYDVLNPDGTIYLAAAEPVSGGDS